MDPVSPLSPAIRTASGLAVLAESAWPETAADVTAPSPAGFVFSSFSPVAAEVAKRCLERRAAARSAAAVTTGVTTGAITGVIVASSLGDLAGAQHVARAVDTGGRVGPLLFFQCVPNAVAGYAAARWQLTGPVACLGGELVCVRIVPRNRKELGRDEEPAGLHDAIDRGLGFGPFRVIARHGSGVQFDLRERKNDRRGCRRNNKADRSAQNRARVERALQRQKVPKVAVIEGNPSRSDAAPGSSDCPEEQAEYLLDLGWNVG